MDLSGIISISGRAGLYRVIAQGKNSIIVESLMEKKRFPAYATDRISALEDISIYTYEGDKPLKEIFTLIYEKQDGKAAPSHKEDLSVLIEFMLEIIPDYDTDRVYPSDVKKLMQWYNMLLDSGDLKPEEPVKEEKPEKAAKTVKAEKPASEEKPKKAPAKKPAAKKTAAKKPAAKKAPAKETKKKETTDK
ncbi:MAG: hypothetical protein ACI837_003533 [Crocinitomicaceae bacterium]|jgi:hypothetical protein